MRIVAMILLGFSAQAFAETDQGDRNYARDAIIGWCSAYHLIQGDVAAAKKVEELAFEPKHVAASGNALIFFYEQSQRNQAVALAAGKNACETVKKFKKIPPEVK